MNLWQVSALNMLHGEFREISNFLNFSSNFLHEFFKNHVKYQKMTHKNIQKYMSHFKFPAEHDPGVRQNYKNHGKPVFLEKFIMKKPTLIKSPNLAEVYFRICTLRSNSYRFTLLGIQEIYTHFYPIICLHHFFKCPQ